MLGKGLESLIPSKRNSDEPVISRGTDKGREEMRIGKEKGEELTEEKTFRKTREKTKHSEAIFHIEVEKIKPNPHQPRREFPEEGIRELAASIREYGMLQPIIVSKKEEDIEHGTRIEYQLIAGERRFLAAKLLGLQVVPAIIRVIDEEGERLELAIIENLQREDLNPVERARAFSQLQDGFHLTQREIAARIGKSRETIANALRLLDLPAIIQEALAKNKISESHGRLLLAVTDPAQQLKLFDDLVSHHMTTRELNKEVRRGDSRDAAGSVTPSPELAMLQEKLSAELGAPVKIMTRGNPHAGGGGRITITFYSDEELKNIVERLAGGEGEEDNLLS